MRVIIIGAGKVGYNIAELLSLENHDIVVIEKDEERYQIIDENLDVKVINGSGSSSSVLLEAEIKEADLLVSVTQNDELNMIACMLAKQYGVPKTIARVRNPEYAEGEKFSDNLRFGIDLIISPEHVTAMEIMQLIEVPEAADVEYFAEGKLQFLELVIDKSSPVVGKALKDIDFGYRCVIIGISRKGRMIIPKGNNRILEKDTIFVLSKTTDMIGIEKAIGKKRSKTKSVMILGGSRIAYYVARELEKKKISVKIVEKNHARCKELARDLNTTMILHGDGTDLDLLEEEGAGKVDLFISLTDDDKLNLLVSLIAKHLGVKKTIAQIRRSDYLPLIESVGIDIAVSPRLLTAAAILRFIRQGDIISVSFLGGAKAEMIELNVQEKSKVVNKALEKLSFPKDAIIGAIVRGEDIIIPKGKDVLLPKDRLIIFTLPRAVAKVESFFRNFSV